MLKTSETERRDVEAKLADAEFTIASLQASKASLQSMLNQSIKETDFGKQARQACEEEIAIHRQRSEENLARKQHDYKSKSSLLRFFRWKEKDVDPVVLQGAVAFWGATGEKERTGLSNRSSKETRKTISKAIIKDGCGGELQAELEKDVVKKKRFNVFELAKLSDLESKFNSEATQLCYRIFIVMRRRQRTNRGA